jgi:RimJ/RimL family protein N-acetyltransferase
MLGSEKVRLEVRPWNSSARHVYEKAGFEYVGQMSDSQGEWLVMVKDMVGGV